MEWILSASFCLKHLATNYYHPAFLVCPCPPSPKTLPPQPCALRRDENETWARLLYIACKRLFIPLASDVSF